MTKTEYAAAMIDLVNALEDFKNNRGDALNVAGALQRFMHTKLEQYNELRALPAETDEEGLNL